MTSTLSSPVPTIGIGIGARPGPGFGGSLRRGSTSGGSGVSGIMSTPRPQEYGDPPRYSDVIAMAAGAPTRMEAEPRTGAGATTNAAALGTMTSAAAQRRA